VSASCIPIRVSASAFRPEAGAQCGNSACWDLRGGRRDDRRPYRKRVGTPLAPAEGIAPPLASTPFASPHAIPVRRLPQSAIVEPLSPGRYKVQFTASAELRDKLERLTALMRSEVADGDLAAVIERAVTEKLERLEARRFGKTSAPRKTLADTNTNPVARQVSAAVRRAVANATARAAALSTTRAGAAPSGTGSSSITGIPSAWEVTIAPTTSACSVVNTIGTSPSATTARLRSGGTSPPRKEVHSRQGA